MTRNCELVTVLSTLFALLALSVASCGGGTAATHNPQDQLGVKSTAVIGGSIDLTDQMVVSVAYHYPNGHRTSVGGSAVLISP